LGESIVSSDFFEALIATDAIEIKPWKKGSFFSVVEFCQIEQGISIDPLPVKGSQEFLVEFLNRHVSDQLTHYVDR
jgi:hypothetical protein